MKKLIPHFTALLLSITLAFIGIVHAEQNRKAPPISASTWLNSDALSLEALEGKVVLVKFWTFGCYNCNNVEPYVKAWYQKYHDKGLEVIAVHSPEFDYEKNIKNVRKYIKREGVSFPIAIDNDFITWRAYRNRAWPTMYLVDKKGFIRHQRIGEGGYNIMEHEIQRLLKEFSS